MRDTSVSPLAPAAPGRRDPLELAARVMSILLLGWIAVLSLSAWDAYREGYVDLVLPVWNTIFLLGIMPIVSGIFSRRLWAQRWVVGIALFTGISTLLSAAKSGSTLLWGGALLLAVIALTVRRAQHVFNDSDGNRGRVQRTIGMIVTIGSVVVSIFTRDATGSERGRELLAGEVRATLEKTAPVRVHVTREDRSLVIELQSDSNEQVDAAAQALGRELATAGESAKAWVVGYEEIVVTNGSYSRSITKHGIELAP